MLRSLNGNEQIKIFEELIKPYSVASVIKDNVKIERHKFADLFPANLHPVDFFKYEDFVWLNFFLLLLQEFLIYIFILKKQNTSTLN